MCSTVNQQVSQDVAGLAKIRAERRVFMTESNLMVATGVPGAEHSLPDLEDGTLVVAALVAALVEYRRHVDQSSGSPGSAGSSSQWRTLARWEQLRGRT
jgi:hypothetical protein